MTDIFGAARALHLKPATIRAWVYQRKIASVRVGERAVRIPVSEIERIVTEGYIPASRRGEAANDREP